MTRKHSYPTGTGIIGFEEDDRERARRRLENHPEQTLSQPLVVATYPLSTPLFNNITTPTVSATDSLCTEDQSVDEDYNYDVLLEDGPD